MHQKRGAEGGERCGWRAVVCSSAMLVWLLGAGLSAKGALSSGADALCRSERTLEKGERCAK